MNPFVEAAYAAARKQIKLARRAQQDAVYFGTLIYRAGPRGVYARENRDDCDKARASHLAEALRIRGNIRELRTLERAA